MPTNTIKTTWSDFYGDSIATSKDIADTAETKIDLVIDDATVAQAVPCPIVASKMSLVHLYSSANLTLKVNGLNEVVTLSYAGAAGVEYMRLTFGGNTTSNIVVLTATGATVQAALEALASIGVGNVSVTGPAGGPWVVTFINTLGLTNVGAITQGPLDPAASGTLTITLTNNGAAASQTITLLAGVPLVWFTGCGLAYPISVDVVNFYATNTSGQQTTFRVRLLYHP